MPAIPKTRAGQRRFIQLVDQYRLVAFLARRQYGKTTTFARIALKKMMRQRHHTVIFGSAKLNLSREIVRKEAEILQRAIAVLQEESRGLLKVIDLSATHQPRTFKPDDFADIFEAQRMEFRYYHDRGSYSRTKVVALRPDTVGETGDLMADEIGRIGNWREVWEAVEPIASSDPDFRICFSTTPPPDDTHYSFDMLAPPIGTEFPICAEGNLYKSEYGIQVLRVDAFDAYADGVPVYDLERGEALPPAEHRRRAQDKDAWDRNYGCQFVLGGTAACGLLLLDTAQRRGVGHCAHFQIDSDLDFERAISWLAEHLGPGRIGLGWDLATTTKATSNPSAFCVVEESGTDLKLRAVITWKTADPAVAMERAERIIDTVAARKEGGRARRLSIDATNERYFSASARDDLRHKLPVELVIASETLQSPGHDEPITYKQHLGGGLVAELEDNHLWLPPERYVRDDWRMVKREKGQFVCEPGPDGKHGDTFDGTKLALHSLRAGGTAVAIPSSRGTYQPTGA
jgi:hypothetical protein